MPRLTRVMFKFGMRCNSLQDHFGTTIRVSSLESHHSDAPTLSTDPRPPIDRSNVSTICISTLFGMCCSLMTHVRAELDQA
jgi:hypothetical protein